MTRRKQTWQQCPAWAAFVLYMIVTTSFASARRLVTDQTGRRLYVPEHPARLVSLAPSVTETLFILGLGELVVGDTDYCEYPPEAKLKPRVGSNLNPSLEKIVALKPDLVFGSPQANRRETADQLARLGIPVYGVKADTVDETLASIRDLGRVVGRELEAIRLVNDLDRRIQAVAERVKHRQRPKVLFVVWYRPLTIAGEKTFISDVIRRAGGEPISKGLAGDWPKMSLEEALRLNPDVILFPRSESFAPAPDEFQSLPGWRNLRAVKAQRMYMISDAIIRSSPRLVDSLEEVARILHPKPELDGEGMR